MSRPARILLAGPGRVGQAFLELAATRPELQVAGVVRSSGQTVAELLEAQEWDAVADATPTDLTTGGPALEHARLALSRGVHFATAAKGPLVRGYRELLALAVASGAGFRFSAATGAGLPTVDTVEFALAGARILSFRGILNGTSNFVLDRMAGGIELAEALAEARQLGIADGDGRQDVSGADTAAKLVAISNAIWGTGIELEDVDVRGIEDLASADAASVRLIGSACAGERPRVAPERLAPEHPLSAVHGAEKAITFETDAFGSVTLVGGKSDPRAAGAALLRDVLLLLRVGGRA